MNPNPRRSSRTIGPRRAGGNRERAIGAAKTEVAAKMEGNTRIMRKDTRLITKSVDPFRGSSQGQLQAERRALHHDRCTCVKVDIERFVLACRDRELAAGDLAGRRDWRSG